jgi:uncharacterized lipoprotein YajG
MKKLSPIVVLLLLAACGGSSTAPTVITVPPFVPAPVTPPVVTPVGNTLFSAPQKIDGM